jgi:transcriptional regulator with XRE-family HTH domain
MNDEDKVDAAHRSTHSRAGGHAPDTQEATTSALDAFTEALLDAIAGREISAKLTEEQRSLMVAIKDWAPDLPEALANLDTDNEPATRTPVRSDDPIAQMLGLVQNPAVRLDGRRLASVRKAAGLNISDLASRLRERGWAVSVSIVSAWERGRLNPPPATIDAIAEVLELTAEAIIATSPATTQSLDILFDDELIATFLSEWASESNVSAEELAEHSKRLLATAGKRNATSATPQTLLAILKHFKNLPGFENSEG